MASEQTELKELLDAQGKAWESFKKENDAALKKGEASLGEQKEKLDKISKELDELSKSIDDQAKKMAAMALEGQVDAKAAEKQANELKELNNLRLAVAGSKGRSVDPLKPEDLKAYNEAVEAWMRSGKESMSAEQAKAMSVGSDPDGGYFVTPDTAGRLVQRLYETSNVRAVASQQTISTDRLEGFNDLQEGQAGWVGETQARPATGTPQVGKWEIPVHELYAMPEATAKLLEDAQLNVGAWLAQKVADKMARMENSAFVLGDGVGKPRGILSYDTDTASDKTRAWGKLQVVLTGTNGGFGAAPAGSDILVDFVHSLKTAYRNNARWAMNRATVAQVRKLKDTEGNYLWLPSMTANQPSTLLGYGLSEWEDMPDVAAGSLSIAFGDFREGYLIVDRAGIRVIRDELTNKPFIRFYTVKRVGGGVINFDAIKLLKFAAP